jgi:hypothetical protein
MFRLRVELRRKGYRIGRLRTAMRRRGLYALQPKLSLSAPPTPPVGCAPNWLLDQPKPTQANWV